MNGEVMDRLGKEGQERGMRQDSGTGQRADLPKDCCESGAAMLDRAEV